MLTLFLSFAAAAQETGSLYGVAVDENGNSLEKATAYLDSPKMMMQKFYITSASGKFWFSMLPSGIYTLRVELPGHRTSIVKDIVIEPGSSLKFKTILEKVAGLKEESEEYSSFKSDSISGGYVFVMDPEMITRIPFQRNVADVIGAAPGVLRTDGAYYRSFSIHGGSSRDNTIAVNGLSLNNPDTRTLLSDLDYDSMEEIEIVSTGQSTARGGASGAYINIISKSGQNDFYYGFRIEHSSRSFSKSLFSQEKIESLGAGDPLSDLNLWDFSLNLGGSLMRDRAWYFTSLRWNHQVSTTPFIPWTDPSGVFHDAYDWRSNNKYLYAKINTYPYENLTLGLFFYLTGRYQPRTAEYLTWNLAPEATRVLDHEKSYFGGAQLNYSFGQNTSLDIRGGILQTKAPFILSEETRQSAQYYDILTGYTWGSGDYNVRNTLKRFDSQAVIRHFYGSRHFDGLIKFGIDYEFSSSENDYWKENNLTMIYSGGSPYLYGMSLSPSSGATVGKGLIAFSSVALEEGGFDVKNEVRRLGGFVENSLSLGNRLTLNLGVRFERTIGRFPAYAKTESGNPVSVNFGESEIAPLVNADPFGTIFVPEWQNIMTWNTFSPQASVVFDLFGNSKTVLKASWAKYADNLSLSYLRAMNGLSPDIRYNFYWYDENMDGLVDDSDTLDFTAQDLRAISENYYFKRAASDIKPPRTTEYTVSLESEILSAFSIGLRYINRQAKDLLETVLYDPDGDREWYSLDSAPEEWWVPFSTVVPGSGEFSDTPVTLYYFSNEAPPLYFRLNNVPKLQQRYEAVELTIKKRMSHNWQMSGSITLGKATGTLGQGLSFLYPATTAADTPNAFVNLTENSRLDYDRPLFIRLMGTYMLPWDFYISFFFSHISGIPLTRSASILPPEEWIAANNVYPAYMSVLLEEPGERRSESTDNLDLRISKDFPLAKKAKLTISLDVLNVLGDTQEIYLRNDGGFWYPDAEGSSVGTRIINPRYDQAIALSGTRTLRFSFRIGF